MSASGWIALAVAIGLVVWAVAIFNALVQRRNRIANAYAQIDVQLKRRHDLVPNLVETARRYLSHEAGTLEAVIRARGEAASAAIALRRQPTDAGAAHALSMAEKALSGSLGRLLAVAEAYPELKADETMRQLSEELTSTENRVSFARIAYNDEVLAYNDTVGRFPQLLVARVFSFAPSGMLQSTQTDAERQAPRVAF